MWATLEAASAFHESFGLRLLESPSNVVLNRGLIVNEPWVGYRFRNREDSVSPSFQTEQPAAFKFPSPTMR